MRRVREYFQELYLLQLSMQSLVSVPPSLEGHGNDPELAAAFAEAINDPEIDYLLQNPDNRPGSLSLAGGDGQLVPRKHSISSMALPAITAVTGLLDVRCVGCEGLLEVFPADLFCPGGGGPRSRPKPRLIDSPAEFSARCEDRPIKTLRTHDLLLLLSTYDPSHALVEVSCCLKVDNNDKKWQSPWRSPSSNCWDSECSMKVSQARELWIQVFWKRVYPISGSGVSSTGGTLSGGSLKSGDGSCAGGNNSKSSEESDWVLAAVQFVRLQDLLDSKPRVRLPMLPQGYVHLQLTFTDPLMQAPRGLKRQRRISRHKAPDMPQTLGVHSGLRQLLKLSLKHSTTEPQVILGPIRFHRSQNRLGRSLPSSGGYGRTSPGSFVVGLVVDCRNLPRFTESNLTVQQWVRTHFGRSSTPQTTSTTPVASTGSVGTTIEMNGAPARGHIANAEREGRYTKANSPICDNRSRNRLSTLPSTSQWVESVIERSYLPAWGYVPTCQKHAGLACNVRQVCQ
ncbi:unnamed protein product [Mesocestoides corti]|uniref:Uncharacterized protein n=1 Tax=Mesocestoides corti TaxID=53468 RepID=A0A3P6GSM0_MESCO|nr:unnamed protein product [Mesocestoides corti]